MTQKSSTKYIDYLTEDEPIHGQMWVCVSFLSPEGIKNCSVRGLKIRGVYGTRPEADKKAEELQKIDPDFHVFVGELGKWLPWDPDPSDINDQIYQEKELNDLMKGYKDNLEKSKKMQYQRKQDMIQQAAKDEQQQQKENKTKERLKKKHEKKKQKNKIDSIINKNSTNEEQISDEEPKETIILTEKEKELQEKELKIKKDEELAKNERLRLNENEKHINEKTQALETLESKLTKIQELYNKLNKK